MGVLVIAHVKINDPDGYNAYQKPFLDILSGYDAKLIGFGEPPEVLEGEFTGTRIVVVEFASREELDRWYNSDAYQEILQHRLTASEGHLWIVPRV